MCAHVNSRCHFSHHLGPNELNPIVRVRIVSKPYLLSCLTGLKPVFEVAITQAIVKRTETVQLANKMAASYSWEFKGRILRFRQ